MSGTVVGQLRQEMERTLAALRKDYTLVRTGRASTALLEGLLVEYYGNRTPLNQLATLSVPEPRLILIQPYDRSTIANIEKAIYQSDLGLTPVNDGKLVRVPIPELTEERRRDLVRHVRKVAEEYRVSVRNHRRDANEGLKKLQKEKQISEDELRTVQDQVQKLTNEYVEKVDHILKDKEAEVLAI